MDLPDVLAALIGAAATFALLAGYDVMLGGGTINWLFDGAIAVGVGAMTLYFRVTEPPEDEAD